MLKNTPEWRNSFFNKIRLGDHLCSIYTNKEQQFSTIIPFFKDGLHNNQKCIYIADENSKNEVHLELEKGGIDIDTFLNLHQLVILTKQETYLKDGPFDPKKMVDLLGEIEQSVTHEGYSGVRISGEMTCLCENATAHERLIEYESKLNGFFPHSKVTTICQYNENKFDSEILKEVLHTHPMVIIYGTPNENAYYSPLSHIDKTHSLPLGSYVTIRDDILNEDSK
jgi:hypothetical protein